MAKPQAPGPSDWRSSGRNVFILSPGKRVSGSSSEDGLLGGPGALENRIRSKRNSRLRRKVSASFGIYRCMRRTSYSSSIFRGLHFSSA
ncbi:hypothetical protein CDAR_239721 [Caerostris darwini]|uniref:Uncharacterized protein n=1 Tax=Caerostris darwini TaxID=1538125 RepID=A0AAV4R1Y3_9ARAC|nr:hypothetical protein CDAR_239721 [Caerostris darwini]